MAVAQSNTLSSKGPGNNYIKWGVLANSTVGASAQLNGFADVTVQVTGTFGSGGAVTIQGSMDGTNWATLNDRQGTALVISAAGIKRVQEYALYIRPNVTAGDGTTALTVQMNAVRTRSA